MPQKRSSDFADATVTSIGLVAVLFLVSGVQFFLHVHLERFGILPRAQAGLPGILFSPLLHANLDHLLANSVPLLVLLFLLLSNQNYHPYRTLAFIWLASGLGTWLIGRGGAVHIGASSIVFGLAAFLITAGLSMKSWRAAITAIFVLLFYGSIFYGVIPQAGPISWEGHLCGAAVGVWRGRSGWR